ncbi:glycine betaine ABC transporter substrate-binding protein [Paenibacillus sp. R14(2021)]|uniref:ABC transporter substrate-binding protein n=1 Tax=Paenibacillus sp. R14(2021) TaxID=2859228 RepID=UPI001C613063|nr:glycine betaine ABC transporter substrate-binding protein [Paenibacillus sp. R14(2021)]
MVDFNDFKIEQKEAGTERPMFRLRILTATTVMLALALTACGKSKEDTLVVSSKGFAEQDILASAMKQLVEQDTNIKVTVRNNLKDNVLFEAFTKGDVDAFVDYTGTVLIQYLKQAPIYDAKKVYEEASKQLEAKYHWTLLSPIGFNDSYAMAIRQEDGEKYGINTTSQLAEQSDKFVFGSPQEFVDRPDGLPAVQKTYNMHFKEIKTFGFQLDYIALTKKQVDSIVVYTTDGRIPVNKIKVLEDDKHLFVPYDAVPMVKDEALKKHPELKDVLNKLAGKINEKQMQVLNSKVVNEHQNADEVAKAWLTEQGLLK